MRRQPMVPWRVILVAGLTAGVAAAAVMLAFFLPGAFKSSPDVRPEVAELVAAIGTARAIEPRITGGFAYGPLQAPRRSGDSVLDTSTPDVRIALARIEKRVEQSRRPEDVVALGVAYLAVANADKAVTTLEDSIEYPTPSANALSDLAAAYLVKGAQQKQSHYLAKALSASEGAVRRNPALVEASFNRALALERLFLTKQARQAWEDYLKLDSRSAWAGEARRHASSLDRLLQSEVAAVEREFVDQAARGADARLLDDAARRFPEFVREWAESELLNAWPQAHLGGREEEATKSLTAMRRAADALARTTGDRFLTNAVSAIEKSHGPAATLLAGAHRTFGQAMEKYEELLLPEAIRLFQESLGPLDKYESPLALWTRLQLAACAYYASNLPDASARLEPIVPVVERAGYARLSGLTFRLRGLLYGVQGAFPEQLLEYRQALRRFEAARDPENVAAIHASLAENLDHMGEPQLAWLHRTAALTGLSAVRSLRRRQTMLVGSANACLQQGLPDAALAFEAAALETARRWNVPAALAEAFLHRAETHQKLGMQPEATEDLAEADKWLEKLGSGTFASRYRARIQLAAGEVQQHSQPDSSVAAVTRALEYFNRTGLGWAVARAYLARGRAHVAAGRLEHAEADFADGIRAFEKQRSAVRDEAMRVAYFDQPWDLFAEMIRLKALRQSQPEAALSFAEQARSRTLLEEVSRSPHTTPANPFEIRRQLPPSIALVYYVVLEDGVLGWVVRNDDTAFFRRSLSEPELARLVSESRPSAGAGSRRSESLKRLYDELIRPVRSMLERHQALVIVPDRVLHTLPFASLIDRDSGHYLIQDHAVAITPSLAIFLESARSPTRRLDTALVVGNPKLSEQELQLPDLAEAEAEASEIASLYTKAELLTGPDATKQAFLDRLGVEPVVHFAGHALSNDSFPHLSRLLFAGRSAGSSGSVFPHEIAQKDLSRVRVVVLGGCRTSSGLIRRGEGVISLARPFLAAGVPTVLATLWDLNDRTSRPLFVEFHRALRSGLSPVDALRQAQLRLLDSGNPDLTAPASWAGVVAIGGIAGWRPSGDAGSAGRN
jgi:CHAT domain-containing protein